MISDLHIHSNTSPDTELSVRVIYETAVKKKLEYICITNHLELAPKSVERGFTLTPEKMKKYRADFNQLPKAGRPSVFFGAEIGYYEEREEEIRDFINANDFDFVIGSVHWIGDFEVSNSRTRFSFEGNPGLQKEIVQEYFHKLKKAISSRLFDVIGHIDIYKKVIPELPFEKAKEEWEKVADLLVKFGVGFEINTSYKNYFGVNPVPSIYPSPEVIKLFLEKGVKIITLGSDGHVPERIGDQIDQAEKMLRGFGLQKICYFQKRKANFIGL